MILKQLFSFIQLLNSETGHNQIAAGVALGLVLGFSPILSLQAILVLIAVFIFRVQIGAAFASAFFFKFVAFLIDPVADPIGQRILEAPSLTPLWTELYHMPLVPMTRFNNSIVMGSGVLSLALLPFVFWAARSGTLRYRATVVARFKESKLWRFWVGTKFYNWYVTYKGLTGS